MFVFATGSLSPGRSYVRSQYKLIKVLPAATATGAVITTEYEARFGPPKANSNVWFKAFQVYEDSGLPGPALIYTAGVVT